MATPNTIAIVGTGPSVEGQTIKADVIIAVNSAIEIVKPKIWFTLDPSAENIAIMRRRLSGVRYFCAFPDDVKTPPHVMRLRRIQEKRTFPAPDISKVGHPGYWLWRWSAKLGLAERSNEIHTGNSVFGGLGLAYHMRPRKIVFYGLDGTAEPRVTGGLPNRLDHLPLLFASALPQLEAANIEVFNANPNSLIDCFRSLPNE